jgi:S1-C subfamily serine protease
MKLHCQRHLPALLAAVSVAAGLPSVAASEADIRRDAAVAAIEKVIPSVVNIATARVVEYNDFYQDLLRQFYNWQGSVPQHEELNSIGSGVIIDENGYVLTNMHVVRRASRVQVKLWDGRVYDAEPVILVTPHSDVAVLKLRCQPGEKFQAIQFANDDDLLLGETVLALGDPYGLGDSVSRGILSSKNRRPSSGNEPLNVQDWLQTDAAINPGNSGGPLIDLRGQLIGINVAIYPESHGIGFAIPIRQVSAALSQLFTPEVTGSLWFGAQIKAGAHPLVVSGVQPGSPADKAGLRVGQQILQVNSRTPKGLIEFNQLVAGADAHKVSLLVQQNDERLNLNAALVPFDQMVRQKTGLVLRKATDRNDAQTALFAGRGMVIDQVEPNSPAARAKLQRGFWVTGIEGAAADQLLAVAEALAGKKPGDTVQVAVTVPRFVSGQAVEYRQGTVNLQVR